jgi:hypothetical protein
MAVHVDRSLILPVTEYFPVPQAKSGIAIHHTVCDSAHRTLAIWARDREADGEPRRVGTAYVIDPDGTIYEAFDPACWAWQFGLRWGDPERIQFEKRFIGIELTSEGGLTEHEGELYAYNTLLPFFKKDADDVFDAGAPYRGYRWFDRYEGAQLASLGQLVDDLCARFRIPRVYPAQPYLYYGEALRSFNGVIGHAMVRSGKSDPAPDPRLWAMLEDVARLRPVPVSPSPVARAMRAPRPLSDDEIEALESHNTRRLDRLPVAAGSLVKTLLMELERRHVYLRLRTPAPDARAVRYDVVRGDHGEVARLGRALGFTRATDGLLEVRSA